MTKPIDANNSDYIKDKLPTGIKISGEIKNTGEMTIEGETMPKDDNIESKRLDDILLQFAMDIADADRSTKHWLFGADKDIFATKCDEAIAKAKYAFQQIKAKHKPSGKNSEICNCDGFWHVSINDNTHYISGVEAKIAEARLDERKQVALDNYRGQTFSESTDWKGKFDKFVENNERRIANLTPNNKDNK